jgi:hypothetical protein
MCETALQASACCSSSSLAFAILRGVEWNVTQGLTRLGWRGKKQTKAETQASRNVLEIRGPVEAGSGCGSIVDF